MLTKICAAFALVAVATAAPAATAPTRLVGHIPVCSGSPKVCVQTAVNFKVVPTPAAQVLRDFAVMDEE
jgi:hypothetical protein